MSMTLEDLMQRMQSTHNIAPKPVDIPVWGRIYVRPQTVEEADEAVERAGGREEFSKLFESRKRRLALRAAQVICNESGERLFDPSSAEHLDYLTSQPWDLLRQVHESVHNMLTEGQPEKN